MSLASESYVDRVIRADRGDAHTRLDHILVRHLADLDRVSRAEIQRWIDDGRVLVNHVAVRRAATRLSTGDEVRVQLPPPSPRVEHAAEPSTLSVIFEDEHFLAIDKPPGAVVHPTRGHRADTLFNGLLWHLRDAPGTRPGLVHRLDKDTSGLLLVAKHRLAHARMARALQSRAASKEYLAIVYGRPRRLHGRIALPLARNPEDPRRMRVDEHGRESVTDFACLGSSEGVRRGLSAVCCRLLTGRMHQIRVHLQSRRLPIVGDPMYGAPGWQKLRDPDLAALARSFPRQALHAWRVTLAHPMTGTLLDLRAPVPRDMVALLAAAGLDAASDFTCHPAVTS
jgi:23S rRNA pseudouridine1911/1915/1917 synthase